MTRTSHRLVLVLALVALGAGCRKYQQPIEPAPVPPTPTPASAVSGDDTLAAMLSVEYHANLAGRPKRTLPSYLDVLPLDQAVEILLRDPGADAHRWRQRAVVTLAAASIEKFRSHLLVLGAPLPQLQMLRRTVQIRQVDWWKYILDYHIELIYPAWYRFLGEALPTETPTPTLTPTPTWTARPPVTPTPTRTRTPGPPTPTATWTPGATTMAEAPCAAAVPVGTPILCDGPGVPVAACVRPTSYAGGTWVQVTSVLSVNRPPDHVGKILDPQNWHTCNPTYFLASYVLPKPSDTYAYPSVCADVSTPPSPGTPYSDGSAWRDVVYEDFKAGPLGWFRNRIEVDVTLATPTAYHYDYWLHGAICSRIGLDTAGGGLDIDEGEIDVVGTALSSTISAVKKISFTDRYNTTGDQLDADLHKWGGLSHMGGELQKSLCDCVP